MLPTHKSTCNIPYGVTSLQGLPDGSRLQLLPPPMAPASSLSATGTLPLRLTGLGTSEAPAPAPLAAASAGIPASTGAASAQGFTLWQRPPAATAPRPLAALRQSDPVADLTLGPAKQSPISQLTGLGARQGGIGVTGPANSNSNSMETLSAEGLVTQWKAHVKQMAALLVQRDSGDPAGRPAINQQLNAVAMAAVGAPLSSWCRAESQRCRRLSCSAKSNVGYPTLQ